MDCEFATRLAAEWKVPIAMRVTPADIAPSPAVTQGIRLMIHEAVVNALKHAHPSKVTVAVNSGESVRVGRTEFAFCDPVPVGTGPTLVPGELSATPRFSEQQQRVLRALCRPLLGDRFAVPASNRDIADALCVSVDTVKSHLHLLFDRFGIGDVPQNRKRAELARQAIERGAVTH